MGNIIISDRSLACMIAELSRYPNCETGGLLIGTRDKGNISIIESTDAGMCAMHELGRVVIDIQYSKHLMDTVSDIYKEKMYLLGIWHKHNHDFNPPFSIDDHECHEMLRKQLKNDIVSVLFQKKQDDEYVMRVFRYCHKKCLIEEEFEVIELSRLVSYRFLGD